MHLYIGNARFVGGTDSSNIYIYIVLRDGLGFGGNCFIPVGARDCKQVAHSKACIYIYVIYKYILYGVLYFLVHLDTLIRENDQTATGAAPTANLLILRAVQVYRDVLDEFFALFTGMCEDFPFSTAIWTSPAGLEQVRGNGSGYLIVRMCY